MRPIPRLSEYYLKNGSLYLRSKFAKRFRLGLIVGMIVGFLVVPKVTQSYLSEPYTWHYEKTKYTQYILDSNPKLSEKEATTIATTIIKWSGYYKIDHNLVFAIAKVESTFDKYAISNAGAMGLLQVMMKVHIDKIMEAKDELNNPELFDINTNTYIGLKILRSCMDKYSLQKSLLCYNGSMDHPAGYDQKVLHEYNSLRA